MPQIFLSSIHSSLEEFAVPIQATSSIKTLNLVGLPLSLSHNIGPEIGAGLEAGSGTGFGVIGIGGAGSGSKISSGSLISSGLPEGLFSAKLSTSGELFSADLIFRASTGADSMAATFPSLAKPGSNDSLDKSIIGPALKGLI